MVFPKYFVYKRGLPDGGEQATSLPPAVHVVDEIVYILSDDDESVVEVDSNGVPLNAGSHRPLVHFPTAADSAWMVPSKNGGNPSLGNLAKLQQTNTYGNWTNADPSSLTIDQLNAINFPRKAIGCSTWQSKLLLLNDDKEKYGHCQVPRSHDDELEGCASNQILEHAKTDERFTTLKRKDGAWSCGLCGTHNMQMSDLVPHCHGKKHTAAFTTNKQISKQGFVLHNDGCWSCSLCQVYGLRVTDVQRHIAGKKHKAALKQNK